MQELAVSLITEDMPDIKEQDITKLISIIEEASDINRDNFLSQEQLIDERWIPSRKTVIETFQNKVNQSDLHICIDSFIQLAKSKGWGSRDNLDAKFITHIKIMLQSDKIKPCIDVPDDMY